MLQQIDDNRFHLGALVRHRRLGWALATVGGLASAVTLHAQAVSRPEIPPAALT